MIMCMHVCTLQCNLSLGVVILTLCDLGCTAFLSLCDRLAHTVWVRLCAGVCVEDVRRHFDWLTVFVPDCICMTVPFKIFKWITQRTFCAQLWVTSVMTTKCCLSIFICWMGQRSCLCGQRSTILQNCSRVSNTNTASDLTEVTQNPAIFYCCFFIQNKMLPFALHQLQTHM